jgi:hypothetical protein
VKSKPYHDEVPALTASPTNFMYNI